VQIKLLEADMANGWTPERRGRQAALICSWRPWEQSSGPATEAGKAVVASNAWKGGTRQVLRDLSQALGEQREVLRTV
jgi:hypothetical protein